MHYTSFIIRPEVESQRRKEGAFLKSQKTSKTSFFLRAFIKFGGETPEWMDGMLQSFPIELNVVKLSQFSLPFELFINLL